jgi:hypothetical protein
MFPSPAKTVIENIMLPRAYEEEPHTTETPSPISKFKDSVALEETSLQ